MRVAGFRWNKQQEKNRMSGHGMGFVNDKNFGSGQMPTNLFVDGCDLHKDN